jgi:hypothetical protein
MLRPDPSLEWTATGQRVTDVGFSTETVSVYFTAPKKRRALRAEGPAILQAMCS